MRSLHTFAARGGSPQRASPSAGAYNLEGDITLTGAFVDYGLVLCRFGDVIGDYGWLSGGGGNLGAEVTCQKPMSERLEPPGPPLPAAAAESGLRRRKRSDPDVMRLPSLDAPLTTDDVLATLGL